MAQSIEQVTADATEQLDERGVVARVGPEDQRGQEVADHPLELAPIAHVTERPEHDVVLPGVAMQQDRERGAEDLEKRGAGSLAQGAQGIGQLVRDAHALHGAPKPLL